MEISSAATRTIHVSYAISVLSCLVLLLKLAVRSRASRRLGWDDLFATLSYVISIPLTIAIYFQAEHGMGYHASELPVEEVVQQTKWFWVSVWLYLTALGLSKIAILMQYLRIFIGKGTVIATWICVVFVAAYTIQGAFVGIFLCNPPAAFWERSKGFCINQPPWYYVSTGFNIVTDFAIILIPIPALRSLHVSRSRKIGICLIFSVGGFGCIVSVYRLHILVALQKEVDSGDLSSKNAAAAMWSEVEVAICIICACLPSLNPIFKWLFARTGLNRSGSSVDKPPGQRPTTNSNTLSYPTRTYQREGWSRHNGSRTVLGNTFFGSAHASMRASTESTRRQDAAEQFELGQTRNGLRLPPTPQPGQIAVETTFEVRSIINVDHALVEVRTASVGDTRSSMESEEIRLVPEAHRGWYHTQIERDRQ